MMWARFLVARVSPVIAIVVAVAAALAPTPAGAATFSTPGSQLTIKAGTHALQQQSFSTYGNHSLSDNAFPPTFDFSSSSITMSVTGGRRFDFSATATSTTNTTSSEESPNAIAIVSFQQTFTTTTPQWIQVTARVDSPPADPAVASEFSFRRIGQSPLFTPGDTGGNDQTYNALLPAGNYRATGGVDTKAFAPTTHVGNVVGTVLIMNLADFDGNLSVGAGDLPTLKTNFGTTSSTFAKGDINGDTLTDGFDVLLYQRQMGTHTLAMPAVGAVPEPGTLVLVGVAVAVAGALNRKR